MTIDPIFRSDFSGRTWPGLAGTAGDRVTLFFFLFDVVCCLFVDGAFANVLGLTLAWTSAHWRSKKTTWTRSWKATAPMAAIGNDDSWSFNSSSFIRKEGSRLTERSRRMSKVAELKDRQHGDYTEIEHEKDFLKLTTSSPFVVVHFYQNGFRRCDIVHRHLAVCLSGACATHIRLSPS